MAKRESRRQRDRARQLAKLEAENTRLHHELQSERNAKWQALSERDKRLTDEQVADLRAQLLVLQSDRDRLTASLETCTRRLASPTAEKDVTRAGWRAANLASSQHYRDQAPIEKAR